MTKFVNQESIAEMRAIVGNDASEMAIIRSLLLAKNDVTTAVNLFFDENQSNKLALPSVPSQTRPRGTKSKPIRQASQTSSLKRTSKFSLSERKPAKRQYNEQAETLPISSVNPEVPEEMFSTEPIFSKEEEHSVKEAADQKPKAEEQFKQEKIEEEEKISQTLMKSGHFEDSKPQMSNWVLLGETTIQALSTAKDVSLKWGEDVQFSFPKPKDSDSGKRRGSGKFPKNFSNSHAFEIVRFSTKTMGEVHKTLKSQLFFFFFFGDP